MKRRREFVVAAAGGNDPYAYVNGNPETATDPSGHFMVGGDGSTANTESDGNGGTRLTIHQSDGSTQSTDETGAPDPIPGAPAPSPHAAPAPHHSGGGSVHGHSGGNKKPQKSPGKTSQPKQQCVSLNCKAGKATAALLKHWAQEDAADALKSDALNVVVDFINLAVQSLLSGGFAMITRVLQALGSLVPHIMRTVVDYYVWKGESVPDWVRQAVIVSDQLATAANLVNAALAFVSFGVTDLVTAGLKNVLQGPVASMALSLVGFGLSSMTEAADERNYDRYELARNGSQWALDKCYSELGVAGCN